MPLPSQIPDANVLITVKTYPLPSHKYSELVCTAGILETGEWIRIYPIPFRSLAYQSQYKKYNWVRLDLEKNPSDFRPESYSPRRKLDEPIKLTGTIGTTDGWTERKALVLKDVYRSMNDLIAEAKGETKKSLAILKPTEIVDFVIEDDEREWKSDWLAQLNQYSLFDVGDEGQGKLRKVVRKLPFKFSYKFLSEGDNHPRQLMIEDWEVGALYWNCLKRADGDEQIAKHLVRKQYFDSFVAKKDIHLFLGTTLQFHNVSPNPFVIVGVFYPPKTAQPPLF
jgi:hypothetical protein